MDDSIRLVAAAAALASYGLMCAGIYRRERAQARRRAAQASTLAAQAGNDPVLVLHATQTGQAEALAWQTAQALKAAGIGALVQPLNTTTPAQLAGARRALFIASTYGEGDAPDGASLFVEKAMGAGTPPDLRALRYGLLALGDSEYSHFCGFGRTLDRWLRDRGAQPEFERIDVDNGDPAALSAWRDALGLAGDTAAADDAAPPPFQPWRLVERRHLNPGSEGGPVFHVVLAPPPGMAADWRSGDLVQVAVAAEPARPRDYSIASIPEDGSLQLLVRQERHPNGSLGAASGLLTSTLSPGDSVALRLRPHPGFQLGDNARRPLILIGNGTGLAGLRAHLRARVRDGQGDNWLVFGERHAHADFLHREEIEAWQREGMLRRLDMVFSRDQPERRYVQHALLREAAALNEWLDRGAAVYVCGSLQGMATGVDGALRQVAGPVRMERLIAEGRYRRDVY